VTPRLEAFPLPGLPEVEPGFDLSLLAVEAAVRAGIELGGEDVLVFAQKVVSKAEGRLRALSAVQPSARARELAAQLGKDPRMVQLSLDESTEVIRAERGVLITRTTQGHVCANSGIDSSNVPGDVVSLLPEDPDRSARRLRERLGEILGAPPAVTAVIISDSFGRAWRVGQVEVAIGCAGLRPVEDCRGAIDAQAQELTATVLATADEAASAAGLVRTKAGGEGIVLVRGLARFVTVEHGPGAAALLRSRAEDLFT
jgi:coenzyme F420-0:L-glutamate ligase/coenzyme F420-1:gamma-L-glutamate ligase